MGLPARGRCLLEGWQTVWRAPLAAKLNGAVWSFLLIRTLLVLPQLSAIEPIVRLSAFALLFGCMAVAALRSSRWPVLLMAIYFVSDLTTFAARPSLAVLLQAHGLLLMGVCLAAGAAQWRRLNWGIFGQGHDRRAADPAAPHPIQNALMHLAETPPTLTIVAALCALPLAFILLVVNAAVVLGGRPGEATVAVAVDLTFGLGGVTLLLALLRGSRLAALTLIALALAPMVRDILGGSAGIGSAIWLLLVPTPLAALIAAAWRRMTWKVLGAVSPTRTQTADSFA
jgi:hypothetical protein